MFLFQQCFLYFSSKHSIFSVRVVSTRAQKHTQIKCASMETRQKNIYFTKGYIHIKYSVLLRKTLIKFHYVHWEMQAILQSLKYQDSLGSVQGFQGYVTGFLGPMPGSLSSVPGFLGSVPEFLGSVPGFLGCVPGFQVLYQGSWIQCLDFIKKLRKGNNYAQFCLYSQAYPKRISPQAYH